MRAIIAALAVLGGGAILATGVVSAATGDASELYWLIVGPLPFLVLGVAGFLRQPENRMGPDRFSRKLAPLQLSNCASARRREPNAADRLRRPNYFLTPRMASLAALATRNLTTVLAGILIFCWVFGLIPMRAFRFCFTSLPKPGSINSPSFLMAL